MTGQTHLLVVDDEPDIRSMIQEFLEIRGFKVTTADGGEAFKRAIAEEEIALVLLDVNMPGEDGLTLARQLRAETDIGLIFLTAADDIIDRVLGLEIGADDYVCKPVDLRELLARVKAVLRRLEGTDGRHRAEPPATDGEVAFGQCRLNLESHQLLGRNGTEIPLTSMEFDLLKAFADHPNRTLSRDQLLEMAHNRGWEPFDRSVDIRVARLRRKIEADPKKPQVIKTIRGTGYMYTPG